eukprot:6191189-Pleurochrysis_carterae.AAC.1
MLKPPVCDPEASALRTLGSVGGPGQKNMSAPQGPARQVQYVGRSCCRQEGEWKREHVGLEARMRAGELEPRSRMKARARARARARERNGAQGAAGGGVDALLPACAIADVNQRANVSNPVETSLRLASVVKNIGEEGQSGARLCSSNFAHGDEVGWKGEAMPSRREEDHEGERKQTRQRHYLAEVGRRASERGTGEGSVEDRRERDGRKDGEEKRSVKGWRRSDKERERNGRL